MVVEKIEKKLYFFHSNWHKTRILVPYNTKSYQVAAVILAQILKKITSKTMALVMRFLRTAGGL